MPPTKKPRRWISAERLQVLILFGFAVLLLGLGIGLRDPWFASEPRYALMAQAMLRSGHWLFPQLGGELYAGDPPLFMWLQALASWASFDWRGAFLLPSLFAGLGILWLTFDLTRRLAGQHAGLLSAGALLVSIGFTLHMRGARIDAVGLFWLSLACYGLLRHLLLGPAWRWYAIGMLAAGFGCITDGVGALALLLLLPFAYARWRGWQQLLPPQKRDPRWWLALLLLLPVLAWLLPMLWFAVQRGGGDPAYARYTHEILFGTTTTPRALLAAPRWWLQPLWIIAAWLPLSLAVPWAVPGWIRGLRARDARVLLPLAWVVMALAVLGFNPDARAGALVAVLPMLVLALVPLLPAIAQLASFRWSLWSLTLLVALALLLGGFAVVAGAWPHVYTLASTLMDGQPLVLLTLVFAVGVAGLAIVAGLRARWALLAWCALALVAWGSLGLAGYPWLNRHASARGVMAKVAEIVPAHGRVGMVAWQASNLLMLETLDRRTTTFGYDLAWHLQLQKALAWQAADPARRWVFADARVLAPCVRVGDAIAVGESDQRQWYLFSRHAVVPGCVPPASDSAAQAVAIRP